MDAPEPTPGAETGQRLAATPEHAGQRRELTVAAVIRRADGTVEDRGVVVHAVLDA